MIIEARHVEWAVVDRLRSLLDAPPAKGFEATSTLGLFTAVLCWAVQRIRVGKIQSQTDAVCAGIFKDLDRQKVESPPWNIRTRRAHTAPMIEPAWAGVGPFTKFAERPVGQFLVDIRDALAHGDGRRIEPYNRQIGSHPERELVGFQVTCFEVLAETKRQLGRKGPDYIPRVPFAGGPIILLASDMRRIGIGLAEAFCRPFQEGDRHFAEDARAGVKERAA